MCTWTETSGGFYELVSSEHSRLVGWLCKQIHQYEVAEDIAQETYLSLWQHRDIVRNWTPALLYSVARNRLIDRTRAKGYRVEADVVGLDEAWTVPDRENVEETAIRRVDSAATVQLLRIAAARLRHQTRQVFLAYVDGYSYEDIARAFNIPLGTVKSKLHSARSQMRESCPVLQEWRTA